MPTACGGRSTEGRRLLISLLLDIVATYRLTRLIVRDEITADLREIVFKRFPPRTSKLGYLLTCTWCISIWAAGGIFTLRRLSPETADYVSGILAASAVVGIASERNL